MVFKTNYRLMQVKRIAECYKGSILQWLRLTFIKLQSAIKIFVLSIFEWPFYIGITVSKLSCTASLVRAFIYFIGMSSEPYKETAHLCRFEWAVDAHPCDKY